MPDKKKGRIRAGAETVYAALFLVLMIICFPLFLFFILCALTNPQQRLTVTAPIPKKASLNMITLFLGTDDVELFRHLQKTGRIKRRKNEISIKYCGEQIYYPSANNFLINGKTLTPTTIQVKKYTEPQYVEY